MLLRSAQAADCAVYPDAKGDSGLVENGQTVPQTPDDDLDVTAFSVSSDSSSVSAYITVAKLAAAPKVPTGEQFALYFKVNGKEIEIFANRFGGTAGPVASALSP
ncbi:MAG: hypothetical protein LC640_05140, partial [Frankia sp.]|nr:hypothetical protein [Frankia sp.]